MATRKNIGDRVTVTITFTDDAGVPTSPSTVVGEYRKPSDTDAVPLTPTEVEQGVWEMTLPVFDEPGDWAWYIAGTAGVHAADQGTLQVRRKSTA